MPSGASTFKVLVALVTAGLAGSVLLRSGQLSDVGMAILLGAVSYCCKGVLSSGKIIYFVLPAAAIGAVGYLYIKLKEFSFSHVMFATNQQMATEAASMSKQFEQVSDSLTATQRDIAERLEILDGKIDEQSEVFKTIMHEVDDVNADISRIGFGTETIQQTVSALDRRFSLFEEKQDVANAGLSYLIQRAKYFQELIEKT